MNDLISRQAAIAEFNCCELTPDGGIDANYAIDFLEQLPSIQPEIIRCKDCVHNAGGNPISDGRYWCMIHNSYMYYCSDGELRGDSDEND